MPSSEEVFSFTHPPLHLQWTVWKASSIGEKGGRVEKGLSLLPSLPGLTVVRQGPGHSQLSPHPCSVRGSSPSLPLPVPGVSAVSPSGPSGPCSSAPALHRSESAQRGGSLTGRQRRQLSTQGTPSSNSISLTCGGRGPDREVLPGEGTAVPTASLTPLPSCAL